MPIWPVRQLCVLRQYIAYAVRSRRASLEVGPKKRNMLHLTVLNVVSHSPLFYGSPTNCCVRTYQTFSWYDPKKNSCDHTLAPSPGRLPLSAPLFRAAIIYSLFASSFQRRRATTLTATRTRRAAMDPMGGS